MDPNRVRSACKELLRSVCPQPLRSLFRRLKRARVHAKRLRRRLRWRNLPLNDENCPVRKVFIFAVDCLRRDASSLYGNPLPTTPFLDQLARDSKHGCALQNFYAASGWTYPSVVSMLTGHYPHSHGGQSPAEPGAFSEGEMPAGWNREILTLPDVFNRLGWETHFLCSNPWAGLASEGLFRKHFYRPEWQLEDFLEQMEKAVCARPSARQFFYYQPMPLHTPVALPEKYRKCFQDCPPTDPQAKWKVSRDDIDRNNPAFEDYRRARILLYHRTLRWFDERLQAFVETLQAHSALEDALIIITADHGEEFWDHLEQEKSHFLLTPEYPEEQTLSLLGEEGNSRPGPGHGHNLFQELIYLPCVIRHPDWDPQLRRSLQENLLSQVDLMNLVLRLCNISGELPDNDGLDFYDPETTHDRILAEDCCYGHEKRTVIQPPHKLLVSKGDDVCWLYDLDEDPNEQSPSKEPDETMRRLIEELPEDDIKPRQFLRGNDKVLERLKSLGYHE